MPSDGSHTSMSNFFAAAGPRSPAAMFTTRYGRPSPPMMRSSIARMRSCSASESAGATKANISTLSNWCTRKMPRVSLPYVPASRRKFVENPA